MKIVFDLDGTLYMTEKSIISAVEKTSTKFQLSYGNVSGVKRLIGMPTESFLKSVFGGDTAVDKIIEYFRECERESVKENGMCYEGVTELLKTLTSKGNKLYICSTGSQQYIDLVAETLGIDKYFEKKYSSRDYSSKADVIREIKTNDDPVIIVGDTETDYYAAKQNNLSFIFCSYGYGIENTWDDVYFKADKPSEIVSIVYKCKVFEEIRRKIQQYRKRIIGVNGVDTSGKTSFSNGLSTYLHAAGIKNIIIHIDDFHNSKEIRSVGANEIDAYYYNAFNYEQLTSEVLDPLKQNGQLCKTVCCLDLDTNRYEKDITYMINKDTVVIIEGVLLFREPLLSYFDMKIFIDITFDEVLKRAQIRDVPTYGAAFLEKYIDKYIPVYQKYLAEYDPKELCDILIDNNDYCSPMIINRG